MYNTHFLPDYRTVLLMASLIVILLLVYTLNGLTADPVKGNASTQKQEKSVDTIELKPRTFMTHPQDQWPVTKDKNGKPLVIIPYVFQNFDTDLLPVLEMFMDEFATKSCIRYVKASGTEEVKLLFTSIPAFGEDLNHLCSSTQGYLRQPFYPVVYMTSVGCLGEPGTYYYPMPSNVAHEMMHNLGFIHEHSRRDRDCYIYLNESWSENPIYHVFTDQETDVTFPYDTKSIMQYPEWVGWGLRSKFGETLGPDGDSLDEQDWVRLNYMYCDGPHICDLDPGLCERHKQIREAGGCVIE